MEFHSISPFMTGVYLSFFLLIMVALYLLKIIVKILDKGFKAKTGKSVFYPIYFINAFTIVGVFIRQTYSSGLVTVNDADLLQYVTFGVIGIYAMAVLWALYYILNAISVK